MTITAKFKKDISILRAAAAGEIFLDVNDILMESLSVDLESVEVA